MSTIILSSPASRALNTSTDFLIRDIEILNQERYPTIFQRCLSWMPIANLAITYRTSSITQRMWTSLQGSLEDVLRDSQIPLKQNRAANCEKGEEIIYQVSQAFDDIKTTGAAGFLPAIRRRLLINKEKEQVAEQYFLQMILTVATVAFVFFGGSPLLAGAGLLVGVGVLSKTVGLNFTRSLKLSDQSIAEVINYNNSLLFAFNYTLSQSYA